MQPLRIPVFAVASLLALRAAALDWPVTAVIVDARPLQKTAELTLEYHNRGDQPVEITGVDVSCDCTSAAPTVRRLEPGAAGKLQVRVSLGERYGSFVRTISVHSTDSDTPAQIALTLNVPAPATVAPRSVDWSLHAPADEQSIEITAAAGLGLVVSQVQSTSGAFQARLETIEAGRHYRLFVKPSSTAAGANAAIRIFARADDAEDLVLSAYANVR